MSDNLRPHQIDSIERAIARGGKFGIFNDVGTGKSWTALEIANRLGVRRILVVCPLVVVPVWETEMRKRMSPEWSFVDATIGTVKERADHLWASHGQIALAAVGYETYWRKPLADAILKWRPDLIIYDEAHRIKNRGTHQARFATRLYTHAPHTLALTATPMTKGPEDLFGVFRAVDQRLFGTKWTDFSRRYLIINSYGGYPRIDGYRDMADIEHKLAEASVSYSKEVLGLLPPADVELAFKLDKKSREVYRVITKHAIAEIESLSGEEGTAVSSIAATNLVRQAQITSGFIKVEDGRELALNTTKLDRLSELLEDINRRVVVFCRFRRDVAMVNAMVAQTGRDTWALDGRISNVKKREAIASFRESEAGVLVCQIRVASLGIDLTCADVGVFYSLDFDLINYIQARGRLDREGQHNQVTFYHLVADGTVDRQVYAALANKEQIVTGVMDRATAIALLNGEPRDTSLPSGVVSATDIFQLDSAEPVLTRL